MDHSIHGLLTSHSLQRRRRSEIMVCVRDIYEHPMIQFPNCSFAVMVAYLTVAVECTTCNGLFHSFRRFEFSSSVFVPERKSAIGPDGSQCSMYRVKCNVVDSVDVLESVGCAIGTVALECEIILRILSIGILDGNTTLDATKGKT